ncbi:MAG: transposase [Methanosarcina sp.]|uniref:RNA-guided endonuclease InsQ/TnpB family protein n=1 Tax=Methanosarcina sp. TaxID=2213 RepID=UPI00260C48A5|nr:transposase [Methanosarcina sp.]MDD3245433.1 transposase [Methanosarcina sp.]
MALVTRTEQIQFKSNSVSVLAHASKNLFNTANYIIRQRFFENDKLYQETGEKGEGIWYKQLYSMLKNTEQYRALPAQTAQQVLKLLDKSWKSFFKALKVYAKSPELFMGRPKPPKYKHKDGKHILVFTNQQCKIVNGILIFPKAVNLELKTRLVDVDLREVRVISNANKYTCEIVYDKTVSENEINSSRVLGIDLGVRNIATIANNFGANPIVVKGYTANNINQFYNMKKARIQHIYDLAKIKWGSKLAKLDFKRNNMIKDYFHKLSRGIVNYAIKNNVKSIIIGKNENWKQEVNMGRKNNQKFVQLPLVKLIEMIQYKAQEVNIEVILQEESHTSKCSFLDNEPVEHRAKYVGRRIKRGLFKSATGIIINADVNGALNIIRKATPKAFADGVEGVGLHPKRCLITSFEYT